MGSMQPHRNHLRRMLGLADHGECTRDFRVLHDDWKLLVEDMIVTADTAPRPAAFFSPPNKPVGAVIAIPPATSSPAEFAGVEEG